MANMRQSTAAAKRAPQAAPPRQPEITALPENKNVKKRPPYLKYAAIALSVFAALLYVLYGFSRVTELTVEADMLKAELSELQSEGNALNAKREQRYNLEYVENMAVNYLGMVKQDKHQITYLAVSTPERITIAAAEEEGDSRLVAEVVKSLNAVLEYLN